MVRPRIGTNQDVFSLKGEGFPPLEEMVRGAAELGLNLFEFCPEYLELTPDVLTAQRRRDALRLARSLGMSYIIHASFSSVNLAFINEHTRAESIRQFKREIQLAHDLESDTVTIHPGSPRGHVEWYPHEFFWKMLTQSYEELIEYAAPLGVRICTENIDPQFVGTDPQIARLLAELDPKWFGVTFDFGHYNVIHNALPLSQRSDQMLAALRQFAGRIWVFHMHDNGGTQEDHGALGTGNIDFTRALPEIMRLGIDAYWSLELQAPEAVKESLALIDLLLDGYAPAQSAAV